MPRSRLAVWLQDMQGVARDAANKGGLETQLAWGRLTLLGCPAVHWAPLAAVGARHSLATRLGGDGQEELGVWGAVWGPTGGAAWAEGQGIQPQAETGGLDLGVHQPVGFRQLSVPTHKQPRTCIHGAVSAPLVAEHTAVHRGLLSLTHLLSCGGCVEAAYGVTAPQSARGGVNCITDVAAKTKQRFMRSMSQRWLCERIMLGHASQSMHISPPE